MANHCVKCPDRDREPGLNSLAYYDACPGCQECERLRAEVLSVRESLLRERAGQVKCNSGHVSDRALWDCPVCVEAMRARLAKAQGVIELVQGARYLALLGVVDEQVKKWEELDDAISAWEKENG